MDGHGVVLSSTMVLGEKRVRLQEGKGTETVREVLKEPSRHPPYVPGGGPWYLC